MERRAICKRDGYRCALCDSTRYLQIHHHVPRGQGGTNSPHNLITLCADCHALAHGTILQDWIEWTGMTQEDIEQACTEYLADYYAPGWNPWAKNPRPCEQCPHRKRCQWMDKDTCDEDCPWEAEPPLTGGAGTGPASKPAGFRCGILEVEVIQDVRGVDENHGGPGGGAGHAGTPGARPAGAEKPL